MKRLILRVKPKPNGAWSVTSSMTKAEIASFLYKKLAVAFAVETAKLRPPSQVVSFGRDGRIQWERTYGQDPRRTKG